MLLIGVQVVLGARGHKMFQVGDIVKLKESEYNNLSPLWAYAPQHDLLLLERLKTIGLRVIGINTVLGTPQAEFKDIGACPFYYLELVSRDIPKSEADYYSWLSRRHGA